MKDVFRRMKDSMVSEKGIYIIYDLFNDLRHDIFLFFLVIYYFC